MNGIGIRRPYFAHTINLYGTQLEQSLASLIAYHFEILDEDVENPNKLRHQAGYDAYAARAKQSATAHKGMNYFYDEVLPSCDSCVAMPFLDARLGLGVAGEMKWFIEKGLPTYLIKATKGGSPSADELRIFERNCFSGLFTLRQTTETEKTLIAAGDHCIIVPHEETRLRVFRTYGGEKRPFEESHLVSMPPPEGFYPGKK